MSEVMLKTKLYIPPPRPELIFREDLITALDQGIRRKLTLVSAPAGFGKSTLLGDWLRRNDVRSGWLSLDESDNDLARFLSYLVFALQQAYPDVGKSVLPMLDVLPLPSIESVMTVLINDLAAIQQPVILVLDDYHVIKSQQVHAVITFLLDHMPPYMHLVIASRSDPPLSLARLRGRGLLNELRSVDLRFTSEESARFLKDVMSVELSVDEVSVLTSRTEGWAVGLQMAAVSLRDCEDVGSFIQSFTGSHRHILDYLIEEVFQRQSEDMQLFLLKTSILSRLCAPLCDFLVERDDSQKVLERMERANLFLVPLDDERKWYRYHHLFAELLQHRLRQQQADLVRSYHRRAGKWYEQVGLRADAIEHVLLSGDNEWALELIDSELTRVVWDRMEPVILLRWLEALPAELYQDRPHMIIYHAAALFLAGLFDEAEKLLQQAERARNVRIDEYWGMLYAMRAFMALSAGDLAAMVDYSSKASDRLPEGSIWKAAAAVVLGDAYMMKAQLFEAEQAYAEAVETSRAIEKVDMVLLASVKQLINCLQRGKLRWIVRSCKENLDYARKRNYDQSGRAGQILAVWAGVLLEWNQLETARQYVEETFRICELSGNIYVISFLGYAARIALYFAEGDYENAEVVIEQFQKLRESVKNPVWGMNTYAAWKAKLLVARGAHEPEYLNQAEAFLRERGVMSNQPINYMLQDEYFALARLRIYKGLQQRKRTEEANACFDEALTLLKQMQHLFEEIGARSAFLRTLVLQSVALRYKQQHEALSILEKALQLAEPEGYVRLFIEEGDIMNEMLSEIAAGGKQMHYVHQLLGAFSETVVEKHHLAEPLSERELEVLRLLATHLSSTEIAEELLISANTVRSHIKSIYGKLSCHSRTAAIEKARELSLL